ncbi:uncharacterized protein BX664DRAFT_325130 [Halteromyces radiatus]|uniref:uncharacterized protein n=1 Tax=Halteromyces radiatus TaxID=101107 RepID=UPI00221FF797|nr:uncharacterized protein BX664DRAFT_325130 [Halteromyces radiatus]KAI8096899.1 hypothetical protein BX664DRAFT_325130 [Halteromyces radiatus]
MSTIPTVETSGRKGDLPTMQQPTSTPQFDQEIHNSGREQGEASSTQVNRVICICLDEASGRDAFYWALQHFIQPEHDLVMLLNVRQIDLPVAPYINASGYLDEIGEERREASHHILRHYAAKLAKRKIACKAISMVGDPKTEIVRKATEVKADAVIVGSRNYGIIKRALLGSVSDHIAHHCLCTVIIAKPEQPVERSATSP